MCGAAGWCDFNNDHNNTLTGWTVGGGVEWKVSPLWSIKAEYLHFEFDNFNNNCCNDWIYPAELGREQQLQQPRQIAGRYCEARLQLLLEPDARRPLL